MNAPAEDALLILSQDQRKGHERISRTLLHGIGDRVFWRGLPATINGVGTEMGATVYDVLLDDGEHRQRWGYEHQIEAMESES